MSRRKRIKSIVKATSSNCVKAYNISQGAYQAVRIVRYEGLSHRIQIVSP